MLTKEQAQFATENHNLILDFLHKKNLPIWESDIYNGEDWYGVASIGFCKAIESYDPTKAMFSTYAYFCMGNAVRQVYRSLYSQKREGSMAYSLDEEIDEESGISFWELLQSKECVESDILTQITFENTLKKLKDEYQQIVYLSSLGWAQKEIAKMMDCSQTQISRVLNKAKEIFQKESQ